VSALAFPGALALLLARTLAAARRRPWKRGEVLRQAVEVGERSLPLVVACLAFLGVVLVAHAAAQARRVIGDFTLVGPDYLKLILRELGPTVTALLVATRAGAGIAAELATRAVTEQVEALELCGGDPLGEWVAPRLLGGLVGTVAAAVLGTLVIALAAAFATSVIHGADGSAFLDVRAVVPADIGAGLGKAALAGVAIPLLAARAGLSARGGSEAVGEAVTTAVVHGCLAAIVIDFAVGGALLLVGA
jgi:phospholipid/cholesterol/gamma-HCH transport system permease protein